MKSGPLLPLLGCRKRRPERRKPGRLEPGEAPRGPHFLFLRRVDPPPRSFKGLKPGLLTNGRLRIKGCLHIKAEGGRCHVMPTAPLPSV